MMTRNKARQVIGRYMRKKKKAMLWFWISLMLFGGMGISVYAQENEAWNKPPQKVSITAQKGMSSAGKYTIYWKKLKNIDGYQLELYDSSNKQMLSKKIAADRTSYQLGNIKSSKIYRFRIRAFYKATNPYTGISRNVYGSYRTQYICQQPKLKFYWNSKNSVRIRWAAVQNGVDYTVYLSKKRGGTYQKAAKVKTPQVILKKLNLETTYYVYVVASYRVNKTTYKTPVSGASSFRLQLK